MKCISYIYVYLKISMILLGAGIAIILTALLIQINVFYYRIQKQKKLLDECVHVTVDLINKHNQLSEIVLQAIEESKRDIELEKLLTLNNRLFGNNLTGQS